MLAQVSIEFAAVDDPILLHVGRSISTPERVLTARQNDVQDDPEAEAVSTFVVHVQLFAEHLARQVPGRAHARRRVVIATIAAAAGAAALRR